MIKSIYNEQEKYHHFDMFLYRLRDLSNEQLQQMHQQVCKSIDECYVINNYRLLMIIKEEIENIKNKIFK